MPAERSMPTSNSQSSSADPYPRREPVVPLVSPQPTVSGMQQDPGDQPGANDVQLGPPVPAPSGGGNAGPVSEDPSSQLLERLAVDLRSATGQVLEVARFIGEPDGLWAIRDNLAASAVLAGDAKSFGAAVALLVERYFALSQDWSVFPVAVRAAGQELTSVKQTVARLTAERDAVQQSLLACQAELDRAPRRRADGSASRAPTPAPAVRAQPPAPSPIPVSRSASPALSWGTQPSPTISLRGMSPAGRFGARSFAEVAASRSVSPRSASRSARSSSPASRGRSRSPSSSTASVSLPTSSAREKIQTMLQLASILPNAELPDLARLADSVQPAASMVQPSAGSGTSRRDRHNAALPLARTRHCPEAAARELYVTFVGGSGPPHEAARNTPEQVATYCNRALADGGSRNRVSEFRWRRDGSCVLRLAANHTAQDITLLSAPAKDLVADRDVRVSVDPFRRSTWLLIRACPMYDNAGGERSFESIYAEIQRENPLWHEKLVPPSLEPGPFWWGRSDHATHAGLVVAVYDDRKGDASYRLCGRRVRVGRSSCQVELWQPRVRVPQCKKCLRWGHSGACRSNHIVCARCGGAHKQDDHHAHAVCCRRDPQGLRLRSRALTGSTPSFPDRGSAADNSTPISTGARVAASEPAPPGRPAASEERDEMDADD
ncbi:hypothetical protein CERSUDRAFT_99159 [Gelatoporia subvermispora B]|uniref:Uncharacterized protein n=1 Tax=Ceriporiopsis subvermispora (strain B) TaxID=914234 RepID=M2R3G3_CERS8|nr:hypothetical protein CERSUDRAFT_99159 [Gelatoporia subvermispora B]